MGDVKLFMFGRGEDEVIFMIGLVKDVEGNVYFIGDNFYKYDFKV